jgi:hypothetical protein
MGNYRPISVLSTAKKTFENVIYHRLLTFINKHGLLSNFQFGFRESNTAAAATEIVDEILSAIDGKKIVAWSVLGLAEGI